MPIATEPAVVSSSALWAGRIITGLVVLFLTFDGVTKLIKIAPVVEATQKLGVPQNTIFGIGMLLLVCTAIYVIPQTSVLGAILLTGFLGGAVAIHVRAESGTFPIIFSLAFGVLTWLGLILREPRLLGTILQRQ